MTDINYRGLSIPFVRMGNGSVTSDNLFDPNEQIIFDFYEANRGRYHRAVDIGANIGVHSILMARAGWEVRAYEPDPTHFERLTVNIASHDVQVAALNAAVSDRNGVELFARVLDNTTGSHLLRAKSSYGPRECIKVPVVDCRELFAWAEFAKIDCEGHEAALMLMTNAETWRTLDALMEVGTIVNARAVYHHLIDLVPMWSQKTGWRRVEEPADMPVHHSEGSLFVGREPPFRE
jgi:FkbM family methyltransferase